VEQATPLALKEDLLEIGCAERTFCLERLQEADTRSTLENFAVEFFGKPVKVKISALRPEALSSSEPENAGENVKKDQRNQREDALNHPLVKEAINVFGGRVVEIKR
jgi:hypothetical protein